MVIVTNEGTKRIVKLTAEEEEQQDKLFQQKIKQFGGSKEIDDKLYNQYLENKANASMYARITGDYTLLESFKDIEQGQDLAIEQFGAAIDEEDQDKDIDNSINVKLYNLVSWVAGR